MTKRTPATKAEQAPRPSSASIARDFNHHADVMYAATLAAVQTRNTVEDAIRALREGVNPAVVIENLLTPALQTSEFVAKSVTAARKTSDGIRESFDTVAYRDPLTGIHNRRFGEERLAAMLEVSGQAGTPLSLLTFDIDFFKKVNDTHGHASGDEVLRIFAGQLAKGVKQDDLVYRMGGEEFVVAIHNASQTEVDAIAERLRVAVASRPEQLANEKREYAPVVTTSIGVAHYAPGDTATDLQKRADAALYQAKQQGRNRACTMTRERYARLTTTLSGERPDTPSA